MRDLGTTICNQKLAFAFTVVPSAQLNTVRLFMCVKIFFARGIATKITQSCVKRAYLGFHVMFPSWGLEGRTSVCKVDMPRDG